MDALIVLVVIGVVGIIVFWAPQWFASTPGLSPADRAAEQGRIRTALLALAAGGIAVVGAIYTHRTFGLNREGQITERFTRAIDQLGHSQIEVRLGGIYALERIARDSSVDHGPIMEILTAYVREHARWKSGAEAADEDFPIATENKAPDSKPTMEMRTEPAARWQQLHAIKVRPAPDVEAVLAVLGRRKVEQDVPQHRLDLRRTDLRGAEFGNAPLEGANLSGAHLNLADLSGARLTGADLSDSHLRGARLSAAHLDAADLSHAQLKGADLSEAHLEGANLGCAHFEQADLSKARLENTGAGQTDFSGARFCGAHLAGFNLGNSNVAGADFRWTNIADGYVLACVPDSGTKWPDGFDAAAHGAGRASFMKKPWDFDPPEENKETRETDAPAQP